LDSRDIDKSPYSKGGDFYYPEKPEAAAGPEWYRKEFNPFLERITGLLLSRIGGENINAILLSGSFAAGEGSVVSPRKNPLFLSDLDLVVILDSMRAHRRNLSLRGRLADECESLWPSADFHGGITIGLYHTSEISGLAPRPGTCELAENSLLLWGSEEFRRSMPDIAEEGIPEAEGVRIIENRIMAFLGSYSRLNDLTTRGKAKAAYEISRVYTDILVSALIFAGEYRTGYKSRLDYLESTGGKALADRFKPDVLTRIVWASRYKLSPQKMDKWNEIEGIWMTAASDLLSFWKRSEADRMGEGEQADCFKLLKRRKSGYSLSLRLNLWRDYLGRLGFPLGFWRYLTLAGRLFKSSPMETVRESGIRLLCLIVDQSSEKSVKCPGETFAFRKGGLKECAESLHSLWLDIQGGR